MDRLDAPSFWENIRFDEKGLIPAVVQDSASGEVLMLAYMNAEAVRLTITSGETHFWSRSRKSLWHKGETSGHVQKVMEIFLDCDGDSLLVKVQPAGPACHSGHVTCFYRGFVERGEEQCGM